MIRKVKYVLRVTPVMGPPHCPIILHTYPAILPNDNNSIMGHAVEKHRIYGRLHHTSHEDATLRE